VAQPVLAARQRPRRKRGH